MEENRASLISDHVTEIQEKHCRAQLVAEELITNVNDADIPYAQKEYLDTKLRIVNDYMGEITTLLYELKRSLDM